MHFVIMTVQVLVYKTGKSYIIIFNFSNIIIISWAYYMQSNMTKMWEFGEYEKSF